MDSENQIAILQAMLHQIKFDDPKFRLFIRQEIRTRYKHGKQNEIAREIIRRLRIQNKKLLKQVSVLKDQAKHQRKEHSEELKSLTEQNRINKLLSGALGSCSVCWGENQECGNCAGNGTTGWKNVNRRLFNIYILPILEKLYGLSNKLDKHLRANSSE